MVEIHYHLIFGVDDGPADIEASIKLAEKSISEGVTHIACTPHANDQFAFRDDVNVRRLEQLQSHFGNRLTLGTGCDFQLSDDNLEDFERDPGKYTICGKRFLLVEFSDFGIPRSMTGILSRLIAKGTIPIVTHPERNPHILADRGRLAEWIQEGCLVQITAGSLTGGFGSQAKGFCDTLLRNNWVHFVASDAHGPGFRPPAMAAAYKTIKSRHGEETADRLCRQNPLAAFSGAVMPQQPAPKGLGNKSERQGWLSRIFS